MIEQLQSDLSKAKTYEDLRGKNGAIKKLIAPTLEQMLESNLKSRLYVSGRQFWGTQEFALKSCRNNLYIQANYHKYPPEIRN